MFLQLMLKTVLKIHQYINAPEIDFKDKEWKQKLYYPPLMQQQMDGWAYGLFLMMAMKAYVACEDFACVTDGTKDNMWKAAHNALLNIP
jgi:hypothetical protein